MSHWFHKIGSILGPIATLLPILGAIPGAGTVVNVGVTMVGALVSLMTSLEKAFPGKQ